MTEEYDSEEESVYNREGREDMTDNDEISPEEEAFMSGYDQEEKEKEKENKGDKAYENAFN